MENDLLETFTDVVIGNKTISSIAPIFEKPQNGEYDHEAFIQNLLDAIWYIDTTIIDGANDKTIEGDRRRNLSSIVRYLHLVIRFYVYLIWIYQLRDVIGLKCFQRLSRSFALGIFE